MLLERGRMQQAASEKEPKKHFNVFCFPVKHLTTASVLTSWIWKNVSAVSYGILKGKKVLITAGPAKEAVDRVRFVPNRSSGKMGYAIAEEILRLFALKPKKEAAVDIVRETSR